jgi:hypothetical protein
MGQIIFINPYPKTLITGGIKATYYQAELLAELGFATTVFQPGGPPEWCSPRLRAFCSQELSPTGDDILVFPETLNGWLEQFALTPSPALKVMFCQNQFYMFSYGITAAGYATRGFRKFIVPGKIAKLALESVIGLSEVIVVPYYIDRQLFSPRDKVMQIATVPRKFPAHDGIPGQASLIQTMLALKYPHLGAVGWQLLENKPEQEVADIMGSSAIFLSLCYMEACPLAPLEAMASGCIVVGYRGNGGLEYATPENGLWFSPEQLEEVTDALAGVIDGLSRDDPQLLRRREAGMATAARFDRHETKTALQRVYGALSDGLARAG